MNRQSVNKAQKAKNSTLLPASDILQRKLINRTELETPAVDTINSIELQAYNSSLKVSETHFNHDFSMVPVRSNASYPIQAKLKIGQPNDKYEMEADRVAKQVMRMPDPRSSSDFTVAAHGLNKPVIQKQEDDSAEQDEVLDDTALSSEIPSPDFLSLRRPFFERSAFHLWDPDSALGVWKHSYNFFRRFGLKENWAGKAANFTAPLAINNQLKADNPAWWEITDHELQTSSIVGAVPLFNFDANFGNWRAFPFIQRKSLQPESSAASQKYRTHEDGLLLAKSISGIIQRQETEPEDEEELIQAKSTTDKAAEATPELSAGIQSLQGGGRPLSDSERSFFEPRFGADFSNVRVHNGAGAADLARSVKARAFTVGHNVVFGAGQYSPDIDSGKVLMAHELTHVVQQRTLVHDTKRVQRYRNSKSVNFGAKDTRTIKEKKFNLSLPDPYVKHIKVKFTSTKKVDGETVPMGVLSADYASNGAKSIPSNFSGISILGGFPSSGLTDKTANNKVDRVEGWGYHHTSVPKKDRVGSKWPKFKYFKPAKGDRASMSYALFFKDKIAIHLGGLDTGSLACVHVDNDSIMMRLNYHTRAGVTKVTVTYNEAALKKPCCERYSAKGHMVSNPCGGRDPKKC